MYIYNKRYIYIYIYIYVYVYIYKCIIIILINFVTATISFVLNVTGDLPGLQAPPQPCFIKNKTDTDSIELEMIIIIIIICFFFFNFHIIYFKIILCTYTIKTLKYISLSKEKHIFFAVLIQKKKHTY